jgi:hypothetical protein
MIRYEPIPCPSCGYLMDTSSPLDSTKPKDYSPDNGSIAICMKCGTILMFEIKDTSINLVLCPQSVLDEMKEHQTKEYLLLMRAQWMIQTDAHRLNR